MTTNLAPVTIGRERICTQCSAVYRSPRKSSYCSNACRMKAKRGVVPKAGPKAAMTVICKALLNLGMIGPIGPVTRLGLLIPRAAALDELSYIFNRKGWGFISAEEFDAALRADSISQYSTDSPEAIERKRLQARQRVATARLLRAA